MKKIIKEQNVGSDFIGKTVNWYMDVENKKNAASGPILSIDSKSRNGMKYYVITVSVLEMGKSKPATLRLRFHCYGFTQDTLIDPKLKKAFIVLGPGDKEIGVMFNDNLYDGLAKKFCSESRGGTTVPKADFASVSGEVNAPMTEGRKVVRLTESDLVRLVKKVIKEQKMEKRPHDKMVFDCLTKDGFKPVNTGGKYALFLEKPKGGMKLQVTSQENPTKFVMSLINTKVNKATGFGQIVIGTTTNCDDIVEFANNPSRMMGAL